MSFFKLKKKNKRKKIKWKNGIFLLYDWQIYDIFPRLWKFLNEKDDSIKAALFDGHGSKFVPSEEECHWLFSKVVLPEQISNLILTSFWAREGKCTRAGSYAYRAAQNTFPIEKLISHVRRNTFAIHKTPNHYTPVKIWWNQWKSEDFHLQKHWNHI